MQHSASTGMLGLPVATPNSGSRDASGAVVGAEEKLRLLEARMMGPAATNGGWSGMPVGEATSPYATKACRAANEATATATAELYQGRAATPSKVLGHKRKAGEYTPTSTPTKFAVAGAGAGGTDRVAASPPAASPSVGSKGRISQFFPRVDDAAAVAAASAAATAAAAYMAPVPAGNSTAAAASRDEAEVPLAQKAPWIKRAQEARAARDTMAGELAGARSRIRDLEGAAAEARGAAAAMKERCQRLEEEIEMHQARAEEAAQAQRAAVTELASSKAVLERRLRREEAALASSRLGSIGVQRMGTSLQEVWEDGLVPMNLAERARELAAQREAVETARKALKKRAPKEGAEAAAAAAAVAAAGERPDAAGRGLGLNDDDCGGGARGGAAGVSGTGPVTHQYYLMTEEVYRARLQAIRAEELSVVKEKERLEVEKTKHMNELRRIRDEDASLFANTKTLNDRYVLQHLLGRGGFSEVYKAVDADGLRAVACKVHQLNSNWPEARKQSFVRHTVREYHIHKALDHPNVVRLHDVFEIDANTFCTVLDYCPNGDLDGYLKENRMISEREARSILVQLFAGLAYLAHPKRRVIHYDLKPGNILFDRHGEVKITDFGLSKVMEDANATAMELTSQGAGTYWYLPPECFERLPNDRPPTISNKVDVWAVGVIFFQMLYGRRPFGHNLTQEKILRDDVMLKARSVEFPPKPAVSADAKDFITQCLTYRKDERPDVLKLSTHRYLSYTQLATTTARK